MRIRTGLLYSAAITLSFFSFEVLAQSATGNGKVGPLIFLGNKPKDLKPPTIEILEPMDVDQRGMKTPGSKGIFVTSSLIKVRGIARDQAGVAMVWVSDDAARMTPIVDGVAFEAEAM